MMVLTMNVIGNGSAHGDESRAGRNGEEPALRQKDINDVGQGDAAFAAHHAGRLVESENPVQTAAVDELALTVEARVSVAAPQAEGKQRARSGGAQNRRHLIVPRGPVRMSMRKLRVAPPGEIVFGPRLSGR